MEERTAGRKKTKESESETFPEGQDSFDRKGGFFVAGRKEKRNAH